MKRPIIYPYSMTSKSARQLKEALNTFLVYPDRAYIYRPNDLIINWGNSRFPTWWSEEAEYNCLNSPARVYNAVSKIRTLGLLSHFGASTPEWTEQRQTAKDWITNGDLVFCRTLLSSSGGAGIVIARTIAELSYAPLYTKYVNNDKEYRIHVFRGKVIMAVQKLVRRNSPTEYRGLIRNNDNTVFKQVEVYPNIVAEKAICAVNALGLDFGAVDIGMNYSEGKAYIFEVNTACGIGENTMKAYVKAIQTCLEEQA